MCMSEHAELHRRGRIARIPFVIAVPAVVAAAVLWFWHPLPDKPNAIAFGIVGVVLVYDLPVCAYVLIQWLAKGEPPQLSLAPLFPSPGEREFRRHLRERAQLNDDEFYETFYRSSGIPQRLPALLRESLGAAFGLDFGAVQPTDNLIDADTELDWTDIILQLNDDFGIVIPEEFFGTWDGTFDALLRCIARLTDPHASSTTSDA